LRLAVSDVYGTAFVFSWAFVIYGFLGQWRPAFLPCTNGTAQRKWDAWALVIGALPR
jgi:hypothetical protein